MPESAAVTLIAEPPHAYVGEDNVIDFSAPEVAHLAAWLWREAGGHQVRFARSAFEFARDEIAHSLDVGDHRVMVTASQTLHEGVGLCFSKSHLLVALLRAQCVPAGLCYQRLTDDGRRYLLHGLVAVHLEGAWHRLDPRGNTHGIDAQFCLGRERLAWPVRSHLDEIDYPEIFVHPHPTIVGALRGAGDALELCEGGLPSSL